MYKEVDLLVKPQYVYDYQNGYPLIENSSIANFDKMPKEGTIINLFEKNKKFIAKGYHGIQNKGQGWVLSYKRNESINKDFFASKIQTAIEYRADFYNDKDTNAFRVLNGEGDGVGGLTIDYFDGYYLLTWYSLGIYEFRDEIIEALKQSVEYKGLYQKRRFDAKGQYLDSNNDFLCGEEAPTPLLVKESGENFAIHLDDGPMVGVFLDQREVRKIIRDIYAKGKTVLNTFSYTGAFSIFAALGGSKKTTSVDLAKRSLPKTQEQFSVNNIDIGEQEIVVADIFDYFKTVIKAKKSFDMVVLDPPSFARSKKRTFSAAKDYTSLLEDAIKVTNKNGIIVASTNCSKFGIMSFRDFISKAFKNSNKKYKMEKTLFLPKDFRVKDEYQESSYLKVVFIRVM